MNSEFTDKYRSLCDYDLSLAAIGATESWLKAVSVTHPLLSPEHSPGDYDESTASLSKGGRPIMKSLICTPAVTNNEGIIN
jgi:hypothetical protein